jgi:hypothetical protein
LTKHNTLLLVAQAESKIFIVQEMPADAVHDKESAEKYLGGFKQGLDVARNLRS